MAMFSFIIIAILASLTTSYTVEPEGKSEAHITVVPDENDENALNLHVHAFGDKHKVKLFPAPPIFSKTLQHYTLDVDDNGQTIIQQSPDSDKFHEKINNKIFTDDTGATSVHIDTINGTVVVEGILNGNTRIVPQQGDEDTVSDTKHHAHRIRRESDSPLPYHLSSSPVIPDIAAEVRSMVEERADKMPYQVFPELLLLLDNDISTFFGSNVNNLKKYYAVFYSAINRQLNTISNPNIQVEISGIFTSNTLEVESFLVENKGHPKTADGLQTLKKLGAWLIEKHFFKNAYDIAFFHTKMDIAVKDKTQKGVWNNVPTGVSYLGGACKKTEKTTYSIGIGEDNPGTYIGTLYTAHHLGHILGAAHDGTKNYPESSENPGGVGCNRDAAYVMSFVYGRNSFRFSRCSGAAIHFALSSPDASCLWDDPKKKYVEFMNEKYPGQLVKTADEQCVAIFGKGFSLIKHKYNKGPGSSSGSDICEKLWCGKSGDPKSIKESFPALEGTKCDEKNPDKWCKSGSCVYRE